MPSEYAGWKFWKWILFEHICDFIIVNRAFETNALYVAIRGVCIPVYRESVYDIFMPIRV